MAYIGTVVPIPLGQGGLHTDDSPSAIPPEKLILANNVTVQVNTIEKFPGSARFTTARLPNSANVVALADFWATPSSANQNLVLFSSDGYIYVANNSGVVGATLNTGAGAAPSQLTSPQGNQAMFVAGGMETGTSAPRKLFLFTGVDPVTVISGTPLAAVTTMTSVPVDWSGADQPSWGVVYRNCLFAGGNANQPHTIYRSAATDHTEFRTDHGGAIYETGGDAQKLIGAMVYKNRLFFFKYPTGVFYLVDDDPTTANWYVKKSSDTFGFATPHSVVPVLNDILIKNASDGITSMVATREFGDYQAGDVLTLQRIEQFVRDNTNPAGNSLSHGVYYPAKKLAIFTYRSTTGSVNDRLLIMRVDVTGAPKTVLNTKDSANCLATRLDANKIPQVVYGHTSDGFVWIMDQPNANNNGVAYTGEFQTPHLDFGFVDPKLAGVNKNFDFLELRYVPQGTWNLYADIYIDGKLYTTITFPMTGYALLGGPTPLPTDFMLASSSTDPNGSFLASNDLQTVRKKVGGLGRTISVHLYNSGFNQTFKLATMIFSFRASGEQGTH